MRTININFDFMKWHKNAIYVSSLLIFLSLFSMFTKGLNYGVDFKGGTIIEIGFQKDAPIEDIRDFRKENNYAKSSVQYFGSNKDILIRIPNIILKDPGLTINSLTTLFELKLEPAVSRNDGDLFLYNRKLIINTRNINTSTKNSKYLSYMIKPVPMITNIQNPIFKNNQDTSATNFLIKRLVITRMPPRKK